MRRTVRIQLALFAVTSVVAVLVGTHYVVGPHLLRSSIAVTATMPDAMNLGVGAGVTYRGVAVGEITDITVTDTGVELAIGLDPDTRVPVGSTAKVTDASALGIRTLDIVPTTDAGPYLADGGALVVRPEDQPRELGDLLVEMSSLVESIDPDSITTLGETFGTALDGTGPALRRLLDDVDTLSRMLEEQAPALANIVDAGLPMLDAVASRADGLPGSAAAVRDITGQLRAQEPSLIYLLDRSPDALTRTQVLLDDTRGTFGALLTNLVSVTGVLADRTPATTALLDAMPTTLGKLTSIVHGDRGDFTLVATQGPVCWYDTPRRSVGDESPREPNLNLYCPPGPDLAGRGSANAPRPNDLGAGDATQPGNVTGPPIADDPLLIPTGVEALDYWKRLLEGVSE
ncbi:MCE family protein [Rhodococcus sp. BP-252]|uniref:MlaD family protein n=1 Tax=unclassified Rhodococcus (in: high G+C Gram-positive bacteria) TaxID=192944 RepID=UPI001C9A8015|nr:MULTISPECIES: MCE family protein [unclassified Rhodococcus (in: high G+C Gram-positive bacteria)]MBY6410792.1 MCE family protein [Rhodococcus sp. BP-320]MBY6415383.1 MCE family protein [Rhodococcus sp. BP-321]MBY6419998.1 MCE family protein [Rhodococcus sp. BP-324]MBY6425348.1 MCE family protein [Rhodococcus sp. BP-323]MBY6430589.1 MCE family protein [Rhodococcus sp. BP-322]